MRDLGHSFLSISFLPCGVRSLKTAPDLSTFSFLTFCEFILFICWTTKAKRARERWDTAEASWLLTDFSRHLRKTVHAELFTHILLKIVHFFVFWTFQTKIPAISSTLHLLNHTRVRQKQVADGRQCSKLWSQTFHPESGSSRFYGFSFTSTFSTCRNSHEIKTCLLTSRWPVPLVNVLLF